MNAVISESGGTHEIGKDCVRINRNGFGVHDGLVTYLRCSSPRKPSAK